MAYPQVWDDHKVDRFYGQRMSPEQIERIRYYDECTPRQDLPLWVYGVRYAASKGGCAKSSLGDAFLPWDYGLDADCRQMCRMRCDGRVPFAPWKELWESLEKRRAELGERWATWRL